MILLLIITKAMGLESYISSYINNFIYTCTCTVMYTDHYNVYMFILPTCI